LTQKERTAKFEFSKGGEKAVHGLRTARESRRIQPRMDAHAIDDARAWKIKKKT